MFFKRRLSSYDKDVESLFYYFPKDSVPFDFLLLVEKMTLKQFLNVFKQLGIYFFEEPEVFSENSRKMWYVKYVVWKLTKNNRLLLEALVLRLIKDEQRPLLFEMLYDTSKFPHPQNIRAFLHTLFTCQEQIFNDTDVLMYSHDGDLIGMSEDVHWESMFEVGELCTTIFVIQSTTYMTPKAFLSKVLDLYNRLEDEKNCIDEKLLRPKIKRLEDIVLTWTSFFKDETDESAEFKKSVLDSVIFTKDLFIPDVLRKIKNNLLYVPKKKNSILMGFIKCTKTNFLIELDVEKMYLCKDAKTTKIYNIKSKFIAEQIVMVDQELLGDVKL
ncbi:hypothetical protein EIN_136270 [Entamoeba invadens IP1]|uniref:Uncharacterized protein n=1 Tax=Entamoeba invadens IP1 TaxID=370355 RepID=A0A0A1TXF9_ENTIV|nr:hypothetical protein EIN_136270 [Entamoeba invadens IP1]ELP85973.1 hypothetical protein EIN_136270 [Entamoeba invadens IP1]|eukprot:XP_004185319.1 hypothetical protein EIN_136270 [Entamoeba invadens IP1]